MLSYLSLSCMCSLTYCSERCILTKYLRTCYFSVGWVARQLSGYIASSNIILTIFLLKLRRIAVTAPQLKPCAYCMCVNVACMGKGAELRSCPRCHLFNLPVDVAECSSNWGKRLTGDALCFY